MNRNGQHRAGVHFLFGCARLSTPLPHPQHARGIENTVKVYTKEGIGNAFSSALATNRLTFIHIVLKPENSNSPNIPRTPLRLLRQQYWAKSLVKI